MSNDLRGRLELMAKLMEDPALLKEADRIEKVQFEVKGDYVEAWTDPARRHVVRRARDGKYYCACPDWKWRQKSAPGRACKHVLRLQLSDVELPIPTPKETSWP